MSDHVFVSSPQNLTIFSFFAAQNHNNKNFYIYYPTLAGLYHDVTHRKGNSLKSRGWCAFIWTTSRSTSGTSGCSCLSPTRFNLYTASLHRLEDNRTYIFQYVDNLFLVSTGKSFVDNLTAKANYLLFDLYLPFNPNKINAIYFEKKFENILNISIKVATANQKLRLNSFSWLITHPKDFSSKKTLTVYKCLVWSKIEYAHSTTCEFPDYNIYLSK